MSVPNTTSTPDQQWRNRVMVRLLVWMGQNPGWTSDELDAEMSAIGERLKAEENLPASERIVRLYRATDPVEQYENWRRLRAAPWWGRALSRFMLFWIEIGVYDAIVRGGEWSRKGIARKEREDAARSARDKVRAEWRRANKR